MSSAAAAESGISLLEIIIVLAVLGLATTLGVGATIAWLDRGRAQEAAAVLSSSLNNARFSALIYSDRFEFNPERRGFSGVASGVRVALDAPAGWSLNTQEAPSFTPQGCTAGRMSLARGDRIVAFSVSATDCAIVRNRDAP